MGREARARRDRRATQQTARAILNGQPVSGNYAMAIRPQDAQRLLQLADDLPPWTPFERSRINTYAGGRTREQMISEIVEKTGETREAVEEYTRDIEQEEIWVNSRYQVNIRRQAAAEGSGAPDLVHLSIKRLDKLAMGRERFRDFQRIKSELVGPECEGVEVYPAESRLVDTASQYHIWVFDDPTFRLPWGFPSRLVNYEGGVAGSVQLPWNPADGPEPEG